MGRMCAKNCCNHFKSPETMATHLKNPFHSVFLVFFFARAQIFSAKLSVCLCRLGGATKNCWPKFNEPHDPFRLRLRLCIPSLYLWTLHWIFQQLDQSVVAFAAVIVMAAKKFTQHPNTTHKKGINDVGRSKLFSHKVGRSGGQFRMHILWIFKCCKIVFHD